jgi:hypothetical protein
VKVDVMRDILRAKVAQHEYVRRKLLATGDRELIEDSWRDDFWGWGPNRDGQNMLGKLWMEVRAELDHGGDKEVQLRDQAATANMIHGLASDLLNAAGMFGSIAHFVDRALRAEHTEAVHKPDPMEGRKQ